MEDESDKTYIVNDEVENQVFADLLMCLNKALNSLSGLTERFKINKPFRLVGPKFYLSAHPLRIRQMKKIIKLQ